MDESISAACQGCNHDRLLNSSDEEPVVVAANNRKVIALVFCFLLFIASTSVFLYFFHPPSLEFFPHSSEDEKRIREMVDEINGMDLSWKAEYNSLASLKNDPSYEEYLADYSALQMDGLSLDESEEQQVLQDTEGHLRDLASQSINLPNSFDAREIWPQCPSMHHIQNQGGCGSCWAAAATSSISDRLCISSNFTKRQLISTQDLLSCCEFCGRCQGGWVEIHPFLYWKMFGLVSGGAYGSNEGCRPYEISSTCGAPCPRYFFKAKFNPICERKCQSSYDGKSIYYVKMGSRSHDDYTTRVAYEKYNEIKRAINVSETELIKREIVVHGPVMMCCIITEPFMHYRSGIYNSRPPSMIPENEALHYGHCMKILGWGEESEQKFWIIANSWGTKWGENGFGKISMNYFPERLTVVAGLW